MKNSQLNVLLVEDNEGDIILTQEAFNESDIDLISIARDGEEAITFLDQVKLNNHPLDLILLDINIPKINGLQVLKHIKNDSYLKKIVVVMLSTSSSPKDIAKSYDECANSYITKPSDFNKFTSTIKKLKEYWINIAQMPYST